MKNVIIGCLLAGIVSLSLGYFIGWQRANDTAVIKETELVNRHRMFKDSMTIVVSNNKAQLVELSQKSDSAIAHLTKDIAKAKTVIERVRVDTEYVNGPLGSVIQACSVVFDSCESTTKQQQAEIDKLKAQISVMESKARADSVIRESEKRAWARTESSLRVSRNYKAVGATTLLMGAACYVSHLGR